MPAATQAATQFFTFPTAVLQAGTSYGPQITPPAGAVFRFYQISVQRMGIWPIGDCLTISAEYSQDGGNTWRDDASVTLAGGAVDLSGKPVTTSVITRSMGVLRLGAPDQQILMIAPTDLFRVSVQCLQACSVLLTMGGI